MNEVGESCFQAAMQWANVSAELIARAPTGPRPAESWPLHALTGATAVLQATMGAAYQSERSLAVSQQLLSLPTVARGLGDVATAQRVLRMTEIAGAVSATTQAATALRVRLSAKASGPEKPLAGFLVGPEREAASEVAIYLRAKGVETLTTGIVPDSFACVDVPSLFTVWALAAYWATPGYKPPLMLRKPAANIRQSLVRSASETVQSIDWPEPSERIDPTVDAVESLAEAIRQRLR